MNITLEVTESMVTEFLKTLNVQIKRLNSNVSNKCLEHELESCVRKDHNYVVTALVTREHQHSSFVNWVDTAQFTPSELKELSNHLKEIQRCFTEENSRPRTIAKINAMVENISKLI